MEILDARVTEARLPYPELADSIREALDGMREGKLGTFVHELASFLVRRVTIVWFQHTDIVLKHIQ